MKNEESYDKIKLDNKGEIRKRTKKTSACKNASTY
jgi:hypothetical protein